MKPLPSATYSSIGFFQNNKKPKSREEIMTDLQPIPSDDRMAEISAALFVLLTVSSALLCKGLIPLLLDRDGEYTVYTTILPDVIISTIVGGLLLDNFYGVFSSMLNMMNILPKNFKLPPKESLVIFQGNFSKQVLAGLNRLTTVDTGVCLCVCVCICVGRRGALFAKKKENYGCLFIWTLIDRVFTVLHLRATTLSFVSLPRLPLSNNSRTTMSDGSSSILCSL